LDECKPLNRMGCVEEAEGKRTGNNNLAVHRISHCYHRLHSLCLLQRQSSFTELLLRLPQKNC